MISYECRVGRLIQVRIGSPFDIGQAVQLGGRAASLFTRRTDVRFVSVVDMRGLVLIPPDVADDMVINLKRANKRIERTGVLLPTSPTLALQVERMHREAGNTDRRTFREVQKLRAFLSEVLTVEEKAALEEFLASA